MQQSRRDLGLALRRSLAAVWRRGDALPGFRDGRQLRSLLDDSPILVLLALGQMLVILTRAIDLSVAANVALTGMIVALLNRAQPEDRHAAILALATAIGAMLGAFNGLLVWLLRGAFHRRDAGHDGDLSWGRIRVLRRHLGHQQPDVVDFLGFVRGRFLGFTCSHGWPWWRGLRCPAAALHDLRPQFYVAGSNPQAAVYAGLGPGRHSSSPSPCRAPSRACADTCGSHASPWRTPTWRSALNCR